MQDGAIAHTDDYSVYALDGVFDETQILGSKFTGLPYKFRVGKSKRQFK
jgi:hypothetical protein